MAHPHLSETARTVARRLGRAQLSPLWLSCAMICVDVPIFALALWFAQFATLSDTDFSAGFALGWAIAAAIVSGFALLASGSYQAQVLTKAPHSMLRAILALLLPALGLIYIFDRALLWDAVGPLGICGLCAIVPLRIGAGIILRWIVTAGLTQRRAVVAGGGCYAATLIRSVTGQRLGDVRIVGLFDDRQDSRSPIQVLGVPKLGGYDDLIHFARTADIDMVIIALPLEAESRINDLLTAFRVLPLEVRLSAFSTDYAFPKTARDPLIAAVAGSFAPERRLTKRLFDLCVASIALVLLSPILLGAALAVRLTTPGPILFKQARHGFNDQIIDVFKFRSMYADQSDPTARHVVTRGDPRVTPVGRILRRSSIDELPQLFNVLRGELSLVGPRPHAVDALSSGQQKFTALVDGYSARHRLPPGITGWAQINGWRGEIDDPAKLKSRFEHDLYYIENWSLWLDLKILWRTPASLLRSSGAY